MARGLLLSGGMTVYRVGCCLRRCKECLHGHLRPDPNGWMTWPGNWSCVRWYDFNGRWCWAGSCWQANSMNREHRQQLLLLFTTDDVPSYKTHLCKIVYGFRRGLSVFKHNNNCTSCGNKVIVFPWFFADREWSDKDQVFHWTCESAVLWTLSSFPCLIATHPWRIIKSIYATPGMRGRCEFHFPWRSVAHSKSNNLIYNSTKTFLGA